MLKEISKGLIIILIFVLVVPVFVDTALANTGNSVTINAVTNNAALEQAKLTFADLNDSHWAIKQLRQLQLRSIMSGFPDGTFRPDAPIKKIEAITMAVRVLGLESKAANMKFDTYSELQTFDNLGLGWAKGYLKVAYDLKLINLYNDERDWYENADRAWMARLFVRILGQQQEVDNNQTNYPGNYQNYYPVFSDSQQIPTEMQGYVRKVIDVGLMSGYPDNTFRPNHAMTRAEIATVFANYLNKYVTDYSFEQHANMTIQEIDIANKTLTVRSANYTLQKLTINPSAFIFSYVGDNYYTDYTNDAKAKSINFIDLKVGDVFNYHVYDGEILLLEVIRHSYEYNPSNPVQPGNTGSQQKIKDVGYIVFAGDYDEKVVIYRSAGGTQHSYHLKTDAEVYDGVRLINLNNLQRDDMFIFTIENDLIVRMDKAVYYQNVHEGTVVSYRTDNNQITIRTEDNEYITLDIPKSLSIKANNNDYVRVYAYDSYIYQYEVIAPGYAEGYVKRYDKTYYQLAIVDTTNRERVFDLKDDVRISYPGKFYASLEDLKEKDYVKLFFEQKKPSRWELPKAKVQNITVETRLTGTILSKIDQNSNVKEISVEDLNGYNQTYIVDFATKVTIPGIRDTVVKDLRQNDQINFTVNNGKLVEVNVFKRLLEENINAEPIVGLMSGYGEDFVWLTTKDSYRKTMYLTDELIQKYKRENYKSVADLYDKIVSLEFVDEEVNRITEIKSSNNLNNSYSSNVKLWSFDDKQKVIWVKDSNQYTGNMYYVYKVHPNLFDQNYTHNSFSEKDIDEIIYWNRDVSLTIIDGVIVSMERGK